MIHGTRIICRSYSGLVQNIVVIFHDPVCKGITTMWCRANTVVKFLLGAMKHFLCVIVVNRAKKCLVHKLANVIFFQKNFMNIAMSTRIFSQTVRYPNPKQKRIQPHRPGSTSLSKDGGCDCLIDLDYKLIVVLLCTMRLNSAGGDIVLAHDL